MKINWYWIIVIILALWIISNFLPEEKEVLINGESNERLSNPVTYYFDNIYLCDSIQQGYIRKAFNILENETDSAYYFESVGNFGDTQIIFYCKDYKPEENFWEGYTLGEAYYDPYDSKHKIDLYGYWRDRPEIGYQYKAFQQVQITTSCPDWNTSKCEKVTYPEYPDTEIHEILHLFRFEHVDDPSSMMYFERDFVREAYYFNYKIDYWIVEKLKNMARAN